VTTREPLYTEPDRAELLAYELHREGLCPLCGRPVEVCTSMEGVGPDFVASYTMCRATAEKVALQQGLSGDGKKPRPNAPAYLYMVQTKKG
jgi:hypothetical protein